MLAVELDKPIPVIVMLVKGPPDEGEIVTVAPKLYVKGLPKPVILSKPRVAEYFVVDPAMISLKYEL